MILIRDFLKYFDTGNEFFGFSNFGQFVRFQEVNPVWKFVKSASQTLSKRISMLVNCRNIAGILALFIAFPALADGPIIPTQAAILIIVMIALGGFASALMFSWLIKSILQKLRKEKRKWLWIMGLTTFLSAYLFYFFEEQYDWMYYSNIELDYGYETRVKVYNFLFLLSALFGSIVGYFCLPKCNEK